MFRGFLEVFGRKSKNVADFVKEREKSSIWPTLATFRANQRFEVLMNFLEKS